MRFTTVLRPFILERWWCRADAGGGRGGPLSRGGAGVLARHLLLIAVALGFGPPRSLAEPGLTRELAAAAPALDAKALAFAVSALQCAQRGALAAAKRLAVIDYSLPSTQPRLWVFDLDTRSLLREEYVAHGRGSGENLASRFSNEPGSLQSSLGLFRTAESYVGRNGYSLRLEGLEPGINDRAFERAIVLHGAPYVSDEALRQLGRLGRSLGCPAVRPEIATELIDEIKGGQYLFVYYPDRDFLAGSSLLACSADTLSDAGQYAGSSSAAASAGER
ncbi:murein L,D-transpeptidase catalytic domain family protein [Accumulibacter sp.]|uniref:murein L,D-transpeptidase catalytic domain family protein n=1 Tax=Accumulibacter sp. TaxID=2053492 RepID=UPI002608863D|nr:murein L,D-transpeptidase catalytic domain family protein [Accumulibacter sp.]